MSIYTSHIRIWDMNNIINIITQPFGILSHWARGKYKETYFAKGFSQNLVGMVLETDS